MRLFIAFLRLKRAVGPPSLRQLLLIAPEAGSNACQECCSKPGCLKDLANGCGLAHACLRRADMDTFINIKTRLGQQRQIVNRLAVVANARQRQRNAAATGFLHQGCQHGGLPGILRRANNADADAMNIIAQNNKTFYDISNYSLILTSNICQFSNKILHLWI